MEIKGYSSLWKAIIRPPRDEYDPQILGPKDFFIGNKRFKRSDLTLKNERELKIQCSFYEPHDSDRPCDQMPVVIYMHGNCSSRCEALQATQILLPADICVFSFDFSGCGRSEGEYISLGWYEKEDLKVVVDYLRDSNRISTIGLWGRSMGAATALLHADRDPSIAGMVLDSPFSDLKKLAEEIAKRYTNFPGFILNGALKLIRSSIRNKAKFDINNLTPIKHVEQAFIPVLFATAKGDDFVQPHHTDLLYEKYAGDKNIIKFDGDHNSERPMFFL